MNRILSSRTFATLIALPWVGRTVENDQSRGLKELYARYEANFGRQAICYTYITTIAVPLESNPGGRPSEGLAESVTDPVAASLPPTSHEVELDLGDPSGLFTSATGFPPESNTLQYPPLISSRPPIPPSRPPGWPYTEDGTWEATKSLSDTGFSGGETATGVPSPTLTVGSLGPPSVGTTQPGDVSSQRSEDGPGQSAARQTLTDPSGGVPGAGPTAGTDSLVVGISSDSSDSSLSSGPNIFATGSTNRNTVSSVSAQVSIPNSNLLGTAAPWEPVTGAPSLTDTSLTLYQTISPAPASRVILSVRSEAPPALAPTITITKEASSSSQARGRLARRQTAENGNSTAGFIGDDEFPNPNNCSNARIFIRRSGALQTEGRPLSVDPGVPYIDVANYPGGTITTRFDIVNDTLVWTNSLFHEGQAGFCQINGSSVYATFTAAGGPKDCEDVDLVVYKGKTVCLKDLETTN